MGDLVAEVRLSISLQLTEHKGCDLLRGELLGLISDLRFDVSVAIFTFDYFVREALYLLAYL